MAETLETQRVDKWLHHIRVFKTRSLATQACNKGNVTLDGQVIKPSRDLHLGNVLEVVRGDLRLRLKVLGFPSQRLGAPRVLEFCENQTPEEWIIKAGELRRQRELETPREHETVAKPNKQQLRQLREWWAQEHA
ncbi:RNA-binding S4 domain-containing protein [Brevifollis gellanilyticus]|uniref:Heat-shock protein Hsp15 n=1 Tax=Brevifollis gellanilyticus TaxID=748831 RepID=A0A512M5Q4_9BACT|nr:S4 domain-containing protein [Brevifollis gellanilyticus]GEP42056.1 heat-shock protein Hsp15 [Brevifollis gellanilyticus]